MDKSVMFSSRTDMWETPQAFFDDLDRLFHFTLDACAIPENAKCAVFYTPEQDGLSQRWTGTVWCNPPYGRKIGEWVRKAYQSVADKDAECVVMLLPARTDTRWFHDYCYMNKFAQVQFIRGRLKFGGAKTQPRFRLWWLFFRKDF